MTKFYLQLKELPIQIDKVYFDGGNLKIKEGEKLLTVDESNNLNNTEKTDISDVDTKIYDIQ